MTGLGLPHGRDSSTGSAVAQRASEGLKAVLAGLGLPERAYRSVRPALTSAGRPYVYVGLLDAGDVEAITTSLRRQLDQGAEDRPGAEARGSSRCHRGG
ncbi:hypothetical protein [Streptomyces sp. NRRL WC-3549]|uniref:hypothetical protein n=1 Tax=Streptomyces sp. NRRL WC-3549 TaxID=1463925 RepID=UPI0006892F4C|nr:hypothetical protein [Streptomyces sp. NRRL WC-3549]